MQVVNPIGSLAQIERSKIAPYTSFTGQTPIWLLICETKEVESEIISSITRDSLTFEELDQRVEQALLHELHIGWLHCDDSRGSQRLGNMNNPYGYFTTRVENLGRLVDIVISLRGKSIFQKTEYLL